MRAMRSFIVGFAVLVALPHGAAAQDRDTPNVPDSFTPATFVRLYEDTGSRRILIYDPTKPNLQSTLLKVDPRSSIYIEIIKELDASVPMNRLFMTARMARKEGQTKPLEVIGYSEVGKPQDTAESQNAVLLQTAGNVQRTLLNMYFTTEDLIRTLYGGRPDCPEQLALDPRHRCGREPAFDQAAITAAEARFRLYRPEISAITEFFTRPDTARVAGILGGQTFDIDVTSLARIAKQYSDNIAALDDPNKKPAALSELVERTKLIWHDFSFIAGEIAAEQQRLLKATVAPSCLSAREFNDFKQKYAALSTPSTVPPANGTADQGNTAATNQASLTTTNQRLAEELLETTATACYSNDQARAVASQLKQYLVPAQILLASEDATPGDTISLRIEARESAGAAMGIPAQFMFTARHMSTRIVMSPSLFFVKRLKVTAADIDATKPDAIRAVDFAPYPGLTLGAVFHARNSRLLRAFTPGIGMNVTFMSFGDPRDFDPTANGNIGAFKTTNGSNFEVGAGAVLSLFENNLQMTWGYNLNAERKNRYFGIGFGFVEVGKRLAGLIGQ